MERDKALLAADGCGWVLRVYKFKQGFIPWCVETVLTAHRESTEKTFAGGFPVVKIVIGVAPRHNTVVAD